MKKEFKSLKELYEKLRNSENIEINNRRFHYVLHKVEERSEKMIEIKFEFKLKLQQKFVEIAGAMYRAKKVEEVNTPDFSTEMKYFELRMTQWKIKFS